MQMLLQVASATTDVTFSSCCLRLQKGGLGGRGMAQAVPSGEVRGGGYRGLEAEVRGAVLCSVADTNGLCERLRCI
jgi:hypothetical protein